MKKLLMSLLVVGLLSGCVVEEKTMHEPRENVEKIKENTAQLLEKKAVFPLEYSDSIYHIYGITIGDGEDVAVGEFGEPKKETVVEDFWRYDKILSFQKDRNQIDMAIYENKIDEITVTIPKKKNTDWEKFKEQFDGKVYEAKEDFLEQEKDMDKITYFVNDKEDQWLIAKEKEDGSLILTYTYTYDLSILLNQESIVEIKK